MPYRSRHLLLFDPAHRPPEIQTLMDAFNENWLKKHELPDEKLLYHYTTVDGLKGILENRTLWFGHYSSFNDPLELQYGKDLALQVLSNHRDGNEDEYLRQFYDSLVVQINALGKTLHHAYISCFCESENLLSQWREYSDKGGGYSIGFQFTAETLIKSEDEDLENGTPPLLRKVIYDRALQEMLVNEVLDDSVEIVSKVLERGVPRYKPGHIAAIMGSDVGNLLADLILTFKHGAFKEEKEWRLVRVILDTHEPEKLDFRTSKGSLVPYRETNIYIRSEDREYEFPAKSIQFGSTRENERTENSLKLFLKYLYSTNETNSIKIPDEIEVMGSNIRLRG